MHCFKMNEEKMKELSCFWTVTEIAQQPSTWSKTLDQIESLKEELKAFIAQVLALKKSLSLSIGPDNPCPTGEVNREVKGVTIYSYQK